MALARYTGVALAAAALLSGACKSRPTQESYEQTVRDQDATIEQLKARVNELSEQRNDLARKVAEHEARFERDKSAQTMVEEAKGEISSKVKELLERFKGDSAVEVIPDGRGVRFVLREAVLFELGSTDLRPEGQAALRRVAGALQGGTGRIAVEGHTDDVPVAKPETLKRFPRGNIELSAARALSVWDFLSKECRIPESRLSVAGYGPHRPVAPNDSEQNRWKNRRVEILAAER